MSQLQISPPMELVRAEHEGQENQASLQFGNQNLVDDQLSRQSHTQVGLVQIHPSFEYDPRLVVFSQSKAIVPQIPKQNVDAVRIWAKHFAPVSLSDSINIPYQWADFFTILLLSPSHFDWAKSTLTSKVQNILTEKNNPSIQFQLLTTYCVTSSLKCVDSNFSKHGFIPFEHDQEGHLSLD